jgi:hypothetical protein
MQRQPADHASGDQEPQTPSRALIGLAILKVDWEVRKRDYIEAFVPMVVECIRTAPADAVSLRDVQAAATERFGLTLPLNSLRTILHRVARYGYVRPEHGVYLRDPVKCATLAFADTESRVSRLHDTVVSALADYARDRHGLEWTQEVAEAALLSFLSLNDWQILHASVTGDRVLPVSNARPSEKYVVAAFVYSVQASDPALGEALETLAKGHMLANVLYLPDLGKVEQRFRDTRLYFDTTFLLFALGFAGEDRQAPCKELLELLHDFGAELGCFEDTMEEVRGVLIACANRIRYHQVATAYGPVIEYFLARGLSATDIDLLSATLPEKLLYLRIHVQDKPAYLEHYVIDELALQQHLQKEIRYANEQACIHDVDCVSSIMRLRRGHHYSAVETCKALFVTTNVLLAKAAKSFFPNPQNTSAVPVALTDYWLGNLLWLKGPTKAPALPRKLIIADAYAALQPPPEFWKLYLAEIARLRERGDVSDDQYYVLRHSAAARAAVMDLTRGQIQAFTEGTVAEVLAIAQEHIRADLQHELRAKAESVAELEAAVIKKDEAMVSLTAQHELERQGLSTRLSTLEETVRLQDERRTNSARRWAGRLMFIPKGLAFTVILVGTLLTFPWGLPPIAGSLTKYVTSVVLGLLFIATVVSAYWGTAVKAYLSAIEDRLAIKLKGMLDRLG